MAYRKNKEYFLKRSKEIHGDRYDYSKVNYTLSTEKVILICRIHGEFQQVANTHMSGYGCKKCNVNNKSNQEEFLEKAIKIHGNIYNYRKVHYVNNHTKVIILCEKHGEFIQVPHAHTRGQGCPKCGGTNKLSKEDFLEKAIKIHGDKYDYSKVYYIDAHKKIKIICKTHGDYTQTPNNHLNRKGCPMCSNSRGENQISNILMCNNINFKQEYIFEDLRYRNQLKFDFGILDENNILKFLIEYNGKQHYEYNKFFHGTMEEFKLYQYRDLLKKEYCNKNNIPLYIINYNDNINLEFNKIKEKNFGIQRSN